MNIKKGRDIMDIVLNKWGNSLGLRIPRELTETFNFKPGSRVNITAQDSQIIIKPVSSIESLFESRYGKAMNSISREEIGTYDEISWGNDNGGEIIE